MIVTAAFIANINPISVTFAPKERVSNVERIADEPNAISKGTIAKYHGSLDFFSIWGPNPLTKLHKPFVLILKVE